MVVYSFQQLLEGIGPLEDMKSSGIGTADVELDALGQRSGPLVALNKFVGVKAGDTENQGVGGTLAKVGFYGVHTLAGETHSVDDGSLPPAAHQSGPGVPEVGVKGYGAAHYVAESESFQGIQISTVLVAACGDP